ncbi:MAG: hypothetical protein IPM79_01145 [Polyangiaceae bacterium]|nr:hypothetical protein [Polyangiaceae bacterium]
MSKLVRLARTRALVSRVLEDPGFLGAVEALQPEQLAAIVRHVGLEDAAEIVAAATPEQLLHVLDEDLWRPGRPGADEDLDAEQLGLWLEVLLDAGEERWVDKLLALPEELVTLALHRLVLVLDMDALGADLADEAEEEVDLVEKALDSALYVEIDELRVVSRNDRVFDAVTATLLALDKEHHAFLRRLLERLVAASSAFVEEHGSLYTALSEAEVIESDGAAAREDRRASRGYVSPASARAFLGLCRGVDVGAVLGERARDPVTRAYFRELDRAPRPVAAPVRSKPLAELLAAASAGGAAPARPRLGAKAAPAGRGADEVREALVALSMSAPKQHAERLEELAFLVNVLVAGHSVEGRPPTPAEAVELALAGCAAGLSRVQAVRRVEPAAVLAETSAERLFRLGWEHAIGAEARGGEARKKLSRGRRDPT